MGQGWGWETWEGEGENNKVQIPWVTEVWGLGKIQVSQWDILLI